MPITSVKGTTLLQKLADREQTTSDDILFSATKSDPLDPKVIGPLTSTEELLDALDLAIGSDGEDLEWQERDETESVSARGKTGDGDEATITTPTKRKQKPKKPKDKETNLTEPMFVELNKLFPLVPKKGDFEVNTVKKSLYFFS